jgi:nickel-dependent lactate racemase
MTTTLQYGMRSSLELNLSAGVLVAHCGQPGIANPTTAVAGDPAVAIAQAFDHPLDYPPLGQSAVPGDKVVLALGEGVPRAAEIVKALVDRIAQAGVAIGDISLLRSRPAAQSDPAAPLALLADRREQIKLLVHDPLDRNRLSYLAASAEGKPIYVNRALAEADLTIPIGCLRPEGAPAYYGVYSEIFPAFSDAKTIQRYRSPIASESPVQMRRFRREVEEVGWLLGLHYLVQVVPGVPEELLAIFAGRSASVARAGSERCRQAWDFQVPSRASLVLAAISGPASQQTWTNVARALMAAARLVEEGGAIALCTELDEPLGPALEALRGAENPDLVLRHITHDRPSDTLVSVQLAHAVERGRVYLLSRLDESLVEDLGMAPISDPEQLTRLAARYPSCIVLANAQYARATAENEPERPSEAEALESLLEDAREEFD